MLQAFQTWIEKAAFYIKSPMTFGLLATPLQVVTSICPAVYPRLTRGGKVILLLCVLASIIHTRLFQSFFPIVILASIIPGEDDKDFWKKVALFSLVGVAWGYLHFINETAWMIGYGR